MFDFYHWLFLQEIVQAGEQNQLCQSIKTILYELDQSET